MTREHPEKHVAKGLTLGGPAAYQIRIKGRLEEYWSERLEGMRLTHRAAEQSGVEGVRRQLDRLLVGNREAAILRAETDITQLGLA